MKKNPTKAVEVMLRLVVYQTIESVLRKLLSNSVDCHLFLSPLFEDIVNLGGGFKYILFIFIPIWEMTQFYEYFSNGLKPPTSNTFDIICLCVDIMT